MVVTHLTEGDFQLPSQLLWQAVAGTAMALLCFAAARLLGTPPHGANGL